MSEMASETVSSTTHYPRKATATDLPDIVQTLSVAFYDDPVVMRCVADGVRRRQLCPGFFRAIAESYLVYDQTYVADTGVSAALWAPPGPAEDAALPAAMDEALEDYAERVFEAFGLLAEHHPAEPHYYLFLLGTRPDCQGRGLGSSLMAQVLETCDRDGVPAYLEATSPRNVPLYQRHGFVVTAEIQLPDGPTIWPMWRELVETN